MLPGLPAAPRAVKRLLGEIPVDGYAALTFEGLPALNDTLIMETPFVVLCRPDCKGLCPHCGANLNEGQCDCAERVREEELSNSPFAALAGLKLDDSDEE